MRTLGTTVVVMQLLGPSHTVLPVLGFVESFF